METPTKRCTSCGRDFPATRDFFYQQRDGLRAYCKSCSSIKCHTYYTAHSVTIRHRSNQRYIEHTDEIAVYHHQRHIDYPEQSRERNRRWRKTNPKAARANSKRWRENNPETRKQSVRKYKREHPEAEQKRRAIKRGLPATLTAADWQRTLGHFHGVCAYCGNPPSLFDANLVLQKEHYIPLDPDYELTEPNPGTVPTNILPACQSCNSSKCNSAPHAWLVSRFGARRARQIEARIAEYFVWVKLQEAHD